MTTYIAVIDLSECSLSGANVKCQEQCTEISISARIFT